MIFRANGQPLVGGIEAWTFGDGPTQQNAVEFQPEVVMKTRGVMLLNEVGEFLFADLYAARAWVQRSC